MPRLTFWAVRLSLGYLLAGFSLGALMLANKGMSYGAWTWRLLPLHVEFLLLGFICQLVIGIAYWILPRFLDGSRGNLAQYRASLICLNLGVWAAGCYGAFGLPGWVLLAGRVLEGFAVFLFLINAWLRVKSSFAKS